MERRNPQSGIQHAGNHGTQLLFILCGYFPISKPALQKRVYGPFVRAFNYGMPPEPTQESLL
jgi:hypothetical protein